LISKTLEDAVARIAPKRALEKEQISQIFEFVAAITAIPVGAIEQAELAEQIVTILFAILITLAWKIWTLSRTKKSWQNSRGRKMANARNYRPGMEATCLTSII